jgi:hypothetical protein
MIYLYADIIGGKGIIILKVKQCQSIDHAQTFIILLHLQASL